VNFEFAPSKFPPRKPSAAAAAKAVATKSAAGDAINTGAKAKKTVKTPVKKVAKAAAPKTPRKAPAAGSGATPSADLAAVIGAEPIARAQVIKKLWDYIKANGLQDATNKRAINADAKLLPVFGKPQVSMFELAGIVGKHLG
jgi:DNA topoisomerase-3